MLNTHGERKNLSRIGVAATANNHQFIQFMISMRVGFSIQHYINSASTTLYNNKMISGNNTAHTYGSRCTHTQLIWRAHHPKTNTNERTNEMPNNESNQTINTYTHVIIIG